MWHKNLIAPAIALLTLLVFIVAPVKAQESSGAIQGQVVNWTQGGGNVSQTEVILDRYYGNSSLVSLSAITDDQGTFEFNGLATEADYKYALKLVYQEAEYAFQWFSFDAGTSVKSVTLIVYDSTSSDQSISITRAHMIVRVSAHTLEVTEYYLLGNDGDQTYVGIREPSSGKRETLRFSVPENATERDYGGALQSCCILKWEDGFSDTDAFLPGTKEIIFSYNLDYNSDSYNLPVTLHYPVESFDLMVQGEHKFRISCDQLTPSQIQGMDGTQITYYTGENLKRDTLLDINISGLLEESNGAPWVLIAPSVLAVCLAIGFVLWRVTRDKQVVPIDNDAPVDPEEKLLLEIAQLDDEFEKGNVPREDYLLQRNEKKRQLIQLKQRRRS